MKKPKVAFICVHNSCRSQIAEALGRLYASDIFESYSAGTALKDRINTDAVRLVKELYGVDMEEKQSPKLLEEIPPVDVIVTMGCHVECPYVPSKHREDWGLTDPTGKTNEEFMETIRTIDSKIRDLKNRLITKKIQI
jgi:arsenate reductase (thioredoxin)